MNKINVLFVCMANICRSPTAEAVFRQYVKQASLEARILIASSGTHVSHNGDPPDGRAQRCAVQRGYDMSQLRTRQVTQEDFQRFDYVLAMDESNLATLKRVCPATHADKLALFMSYGTAGTALSVPDPYYGGVKGFERVFDMAEDAAQGLLRHICTKHGL